MELVAFWPAWQWYAARLADGANEPWGVLALVTAFVVPGGRRRDSPPTTSPTLAWPSILVLLYAAAYGRVPSLFQTLVAMTAVGTTYSLWRYGTPWPTARWGLVLLSVPMLTSVNLYLGFPLRVITGWMSMALLQLSGFNVVREGVCLKWAGHLVMIDAPCSGVRMLWAGMFLTLALAARQGMGPRRALTVAVTSLALVLLGNTLRTTALFFPEARVIDVPPAFHSIVGVVVFPGVAAAITWCCVRRPAVA